MKADQVGKALRQKFFDEDVRLVFWHDERGEFADYVTMWLPSELAGVTILDRGKVGGLQAKLLLEREDLQGKYLIYSAGAALVVEHDWLFDVRLYSTEFHADVASVWLEELGLTALSLREHLQSRAAFLGSVDRRRKLARLVVADDDASLLDLKMLAVLVGSELANPFEILKAICRGHLQDGRFDLERAPLALGLLEKMGLQERFWELMRVEFSYHVESPDVAGLLRRLFVSELLQQTAPHRIEELAHIELPPAGRRNATVFLTQWRDSAGGAGSYEATARAVADEQHIDELLKALPLEALRRVVTFEASERLVQAGVRGLVRPEMTATDVATTVAISSERRAWHWLLGPTGERPEAQARADAYLALSAAAQFFALIQQERDTLSFASPSVLLGAYTERLHGLDRLYRSFVARARTARSHGLDLLKSLAEEVERVYGQAYLQPLGVEWSRLLDDGFLASWKLPGWTAQTDFYERTISPHLDAAERKRAYVIISDAFRYEAAHELTEELNGRFRMNAELSAMLGVLPSYTRLGMASLLPHQTLAYSDSGDVLVDGRTVANTDARNKQLATVKGMACQARDLLAMKLEEARDFTAGKRVVYVYHDVIDHSLDGDARETGSMEVVDTCIAELVQLVQFCVNKLNAAKVWVTADHGFLFQDIAPVATDKSQLEVKPSSAFAMKKRYALGRKLGPAPEAHRGTTATTAGALGDVEFWVPRGANRFHFSGGARFVHGGAMPQEVVIPLVTVTQLRGKESSASKIEKVSVQVLGTKHKITSPVHRFELIQTEAVSERRKPLTLRIAVYDGGQPVTSVETVRFESTSDSMDDRKKSVRLGLRSGTYDKAKPYRLVLRDAETEGEVQSVAVVIDRSFNDEF